MEKVHKKVLAKPVSIFTDIFGLSRMLAITVVVFIAVVLFLAVFWFIHSAPPRTLTISAGPPGSSFARNAERYRTNLLANGIILKVLPSEGSLQNLQRLEDPATKVDVGFVQGGVKAANAGNNLVSLGSVSYEPLLIFYRNPTPLRFLSDFAGKRLAIGAVGSGAHDLALILLATNGIDLNGATKILDIDGDAGARGLTNDTVDAVFLMSDSASTQTMGALLRAQGVQLFSFEQADAYTRRYVYLNKIKIPEGGINLGKNLPAQDIWLVGPTVELVARPTLNPALSDLLLDAARDVHGAANLLQNKGEFPAPLEHEFKISADASTYYTKSGKRFLNGIVPFWVASLLKRVAVSFVPMVLILIPGLRLIPAIYKWRMRMLIQKWYRSLLHLERAISEDSSPTHYAAKLRRLDEIEKAVKQMKVPASFADQFYGLRGHIDYVRAILTARSSSV
jgi:TRAP-type uncharacterized transport system substrate-binding protein